MGCDGKVGKKEGVLDVGISGGHTKGTCCEYFQRVKGELSVHLVKRL